MDQGHDQRGSDGNGKSIGKARGGGEGALQMTANNLGRIVTVFHCATVGPDASWTDVETEGEGRSILCPVIGWASFLSPLNLITVNWIYDSVQ